MRRRAVAAGFCALLGFVVVAGQALGEAGAVKADGNASLDQRQTTPSAGVYDRWAARAEEHGRVRAIAGLPVAFTPQQALSKAAGDAQHDPIADATDTVRDALRGTAHRVTHTYRTVPYIALELSADALEALEAAGAVASLHRDTLASPALAQSTKIVEAPEAASVGRTGAGQTIAILDTGVSKSHPFLQQSSSASKVVSEACYSSEGDCPGGGTQSTGAGSGVPCTYATNACRHGTHVAGIAAGKGASFSGVARGARLISIQVFSQFSGAACADEGEDPCALSFDSDQLAGLERVFALRDTHDIAAANLSLGGGQFTEPCDSEPLKAAIDNLRLAGIATVISSGDDGFSNAVNAPGCISTAVTVGSTGDSDGVSLFSNSSSEVDFFAPGEQINSSVPGGFATFDGTSGSAPHVAGAWAIARQVDPAATVGEVVTALRDTGKPITDALASPQITRDRIRVFSAAANLRHTRFPVKDVWGPSPGLNLASDGVGLARRTPASQNPTTPALSRTFEITGIPAEARIRRAYVVYQTVGGRDPSFFFEGSARTATLVGGSGQHDCWNTNNGGAVRSYRYLVPAGEVTGNGTYAIRGVGGTDDPIHGRPDGQGASLVVVYDRPGAATDGRAQLRWGAMTARPGDPAASHTFNALSVPGTPTNVALHVGIGDGQAATDPAMRFDGSAITPVNFWSGSDGNYWDDERVALSAGLLPAATTSRINSQGATGDCLTWAYAGLTYRNN